MRRSRLAGALLALWCASVSGGCVFWDMGDWANRSVDGGGCESSPDGCAPTCVDTSNDSRNCGACGHDCLGQPCDGGLCAPITLAMADMPHGIALDSDNVYFSTYQEGGIVSVPKDGGPSVVIAQEDAGANPVILVVAGSTLYWTTEAAGTVSAIDVTNPQAGSRVLVTSQANPFGLTAQGSRLSWANSGTSPGNGSIETASLGGSGATPVATAQPQPVGIAADSTSIYWADVQTGGGIMRVSVDGGGLAKLSDGIAPWGIAVDSNNVYFTTLMSGLESVPLAGGATVTLGTGQDGRCVVVDNGFVYWASHGGQLIQRVPVDGGTPLALARGTGPVCLAVDSTSVYFTDFEGGRVVKVAK